MSPKIKALKTRKKSDKWHLKPTNNNYKRLAIWDLGLKNRNFNVHRPIELRPFIARHIARPPPNTQKWVKADPLMLDE